MADDISNPTGPLDPSPEMQRAALIAVALSSPEYNYETLSAQCLSAVGDDELDEQWNALGEQQKVYFGKAYYQYEINDERHERITAFPTGGLQAWIYRKGQEIFLSEKRKSIALGAITQTALITICTAPNEEVFLRAADATVRAVHDSPDQDSSLMSRELSSRFLEFVPTDEEARQALAEKLTEITRPIENKDVRIGRQLSNTMWHFNLTKKSREVLGIRSRDEFGALLSLLADDANEDAATLTNEQKQALAFLKARHYEKSDPTAVEIARLIMKLPQDLFLEASQNAVLFAENIRDCVEDDDTKKELSGKIGADVLTKFTTYVTLRMLKEVSEAGIGNATTIYEALKNREYAPVASSDVRVLPLNGFIAVANQLMPAINRTEKFSQQPLQPLNPQLIADLPSALERIFYAVYEVGDSANMESESREHHLRLVQIVRAVTEIAIAQQDQKLTTIADLAIRYPDATPAQIRDLFDHLRQVASAKQLRDQLDNHPSVSKRVLSHVHRRAVTPGKGVIS